MQKLCYVLYLPQRYLPLPHLKRHRRGFCCSVETPSPFIKKQRIVRKKDKKGAVD
jgi:hypothetical protein